MRKSKLILLIVLFALIFSNFPALAEEMPNITAQNAILIHIGTGLTVFEKNADAKVFPAGVPKIMVALLTIQKVKSLDEKVISKESAYKGIGSLSSANIRKGEELTVKDLLYALMLSSSNEAANILAEYVSGNIPTFVELMNKRAKELGANSTLFTNATGIYDEDSYTTARDAALITKFAINIEAFIEISNATTYKIPKTNLSAERTLYTNNQIILKSSPFYVSFVKGIKTATSAEAGYSLISVADKKIGKKEERMLAVVLGCPKNTGGTTMANAFTDTKTLYNWVYSTYKLSKLMKQNDPVTEVKINLADGRDFALLVAASSVDALMPSDYTVEKLEKQIVVPQNIFAPIEKGQELGEAILKYNGNEYGRVKLISQNAIKRNTMLYYTHQLNLFFANIWVKIATGLIVTLFILYIVYTIAYNRKQKRLKPIKRRMRF